jgi:PiT family inorganic phosphate transporter
MAVAWLVTFPAAGLVGAAACALAKTGIGGTIAVAGIAIAIALIIVHLSHRNPINAANVNDQKDVKINTPATTTTPAAA